MVVLPFEFEFELVYVSVEASKQGIRILGVGLRWQKSLEHQGLVF
jgi:hypothetical protein